MRHTPIAQSMGEGHGGLYEIIYLQDNRAQTPVVIVDNISHKWAVRLVAAYNAQPDLLKALDLMMQAFDPEWPGACHQDCFDTSDGHGPEMQEAAKEKAKAAIAKARP